MSTDLRLKVASSAAEEVAIKTAWDTFVTAVKAATPKRVDVGGSVIGGVKQTSDDAGGSHLPLGTSW